MTAENFAGKLNIWSVTWCHQVELCLSSEVTAANQKTEELQEIEDNHYNPAL